MATSSSVHEDSRQASSASTDTSTAHSPRPWRQRSSQERKSNSCIRIESLTGCRSEAKLTPFYLRWTFGVNKNIPVLNLNLPDRPLIFCASAHAGVLYDTKSREMRLLHGHQNAITNTSADASGRWVVTSDAGEDSVIIVWETERCIPICTIFGHYERTGVRIASISPDAKYLVTVSNEAVQIVSIWLWTYGKEEPDGSTVFESNVGIFKKLEFNPENSTHFALMSDSHMIFITWDTAEGTSIMKVHTPDSKSSKSQGDFMDVTYLLGTHQVLNATSNGHVISWSDVPYAQSFLPDPASNQKNYIKIIHLQKDSITVIHSVDNLVVTGNSLGQIRFYDKKLLLLYWCQNFSLDAITGMSFNLIPRRYILEDPEDYIPELATMENDSDICSSRLSLGNKDEDRYEEFEKIYRNLVPSDATLCQRPFVTRDFVVSTSNGQIGLVNVVKNTCEFILMKSEAFISAADTHPQKKQLCIGNKAGTVFLYNYRSKILLVESKIPVTLPSGKEDDNGKQSKSISYLKFDPAGFLLACGMSDGSLWFLHPTLLTPIIATATKHTSSSIKKICFSPDSKFLAHFDEEMRVCLYRCENMESCEWVFLGKQRSHYKPIRDLLFSELSLDKSEPLRLFSLGEDRMLIEYDLLNSMEDDLKILNTERIEQSAIPLCMAWYPEFTRETFLFTSNSEFKYKTLNIETKMCSKTTLGPTFGSPVNLMQVIQNSKEVQQGKMIFISSKYIGIQILPIDGNPFKSVGMVGHPDTIIHMCLSSDGTYLFTLGLDDYCLHMWYINYRALEVMVRIGGEGLTPYFSIIEGGENGWLFHEIKDMFYYAQILHQGENTNVEWTVSNKIPVCEIADLMRAIGFYPSEYEIENMMHEVSHSKMVKTGELVHEIEFEEFVCLYINHKPAFGVTVDQLKKAFDTFAEDVEENSIISRDTFIDTLQKEGEQFSEAQTLKYLKILAPIEKWRTQGIIPKEGEVNSDAEDDKTVQLPEEFTYTTFMDDILGISLNPPTEENCGSSKVYEN